MRSLTKWLVVKQDTSSSELNPPETVGRFIYKTTAKRWIKNQPAEAQPLLSIVPEQY